MNRLLDWLRTRVKADGDAQAQLQLDSRSVQAGDVFFACPGQHSDGRLHVADAIARGAAAVVAQKNPQADGQNTLPEEAGAVPVLRVENLADMLGELAHRWYGRVTEHMALVAVTGTNGKTTTTQWLAAALRRQGVACGVIGTLGCTFPDGSVQAGSLTTPDVLSLHRQLAALHRAGARVVALEASSIGIEQGRLDGVRLHTAAFTNLTHDHLDYHQTMLAYKAAKFRLFEREGLQHAVINIDDPAGRELAALLAAADAERPTVWTYALGENAHADFQAHDIQAGGSGAETAGLAFTLTTSEGSVPVATQIVGRHNIANMLLVAAVLRSLKTAVPQGAAASLADVLGSLQPVDGRMQIVQWPGAENAPLVVVDYAHTPDALERALLALRETATARTSSGGKLHCVFGCGGDRDRSKRAIMGRLAQQYADVVVLTSDNPRSENPLAILDDIQSGMSGQAAIVPDRALAILGAVWRAAPCDVVLIAGKGHETYQEIHGQRQPFDDRTWAQLALALDSGVTVQTDSRKLLKGQLFWALSGENFDGHDWLDAARQAGACAAVVSRACPNSALRQLVVGDTRAALGKLGQAWRVSMDAQTRLPLIAVTGSNGKTTVKEMMAGILRAWRGNAGEGDGAVLATHGNLNNELGVPLTLLRLTPAHRVAVVELGMNHPNEIAALAQMAQPSIALVNNAQREHQEFMGSVDAVARENASVFAALPVDGVAVFPGDDAYTPLWDSLSTHCRRLRFGLQAGEGIGVWAQDIQAHNQPQNHQAQIFTLCLLDAQQGEQRIAITLHVPGLHNVRNALASAACAHAAGTPMQAIADGLSGFSAVPGRMQRMVLPDGTILIDDTYNANPESVLAAIDVLAQLPAPRALVLGDMGEVGADGPAMHREVGAYACERGIDILFTMGEAGKYVHDGYAEENFSAGEDTVMAGSDGVEPLVSALAARRAASVLVKGSRIMHMERFVEAYRAYTTERTSGAHHAA